MTRIGDVTRRGDGDARGPAEPGTAGPGVWGGTGTPWGQPQAGGGPQPSPSYMGRGSQAGGGAQSHLPHIHPPPAPRSNPAPWLGIGPSPAWGLRGSPPRCPYPTGLCWQEQPHTPSATPGCFWWHSSTWGHQNTPQRVAPLVCHPRERQGTGRGDTPGSLGAAGGSLRASGSAQQKLLPELARDVLGEEIHAGNPVSGD